MNPVRPIIIIAVITCIAGFVVWAVLPEKKEALVLKADQTPESVDHETVVRDADIKDVRASVDNTMNIEKAEPIIVQETRSLKMGTESTEIKTDLPENTKDMHEQIPRTETKYAREETDRRPKYGTHEQSDVKTKYSISADPNKTISITTKDNTTSITIINRNPVVRNNTPLQQYIYSNSNYSVTENTSHQHPTSTVP